LGDARLKRRGKKVPPRDADREVEAIARWLRQKARRIEKGERRITHRQLRRILGQHGFEMRDPKNGAIAVCRVVARRKGPLRKKRDTFERVTSIAYRGETQPVGLQDLKKVRRECKLDADHGYDSHVFYKSDDPVEIWINDYRSVLEKLSKE
jgi:hypothetical protein